MQAGRRAGLRSAAMRLFGASDRRFPSLFDGGRETTRAATHVDSCDGVLSDAGSTPAASTIVSQEVSEFSADFPPLSIALRACGQPPDVVSTSRMSDTNGPHVSHGMVDSHSRRRAGPTFL